MPQRKDKAILFLLFTMICTSALPSLLFAKDYSLRELVSEAKQRSPLLKMVDGDLGVLRSAQQLTSSYHFPIFTIKQGFTYSNNPVNVFAFKLGQEDFKMNDFAIDKLNNPDRRKNHQTSLSLMLPVDIAGKLSAEDRVLEKQSDAKTSERTWVLKEIIRGIYGAYYAFHYMENLQQFLEEERAYLSKIIHAYDGKYEENKNRYLIFNQGRIILEQLNEALASIALEKKRLLSGLQYFIGNSDSDISIKLNTKMDEEIYSNLDWKNYDPSSSSHSYREDLKTMRLMVDSLSLDVLKEKKRWWPTLALFAEHNINSEKFDKYGKDSSAGAFLSWSFGLHLPSVVALAESKVMAANAKYQEQEARVNNEQREAFEELKQLQNTIEKGERRHQLFKENKKILTYQYQRGSVELYNMLDNFAHYIENYLGLIKSKSDFKVKFIRFIDNFNEVTL
ncbi:MAG: TolC family protein [Oligoflexia bacterium]|nr:TolC family protein [Oligoflexia bacterium]MBF0364442.1 TolC family protein [Oligoflexia bacterium]